MSGSLGTLRFVLTASNRASGPLAQVRASLGSLVRPAQQAGAQLTGLQRMLARNPFASFNHSLHGAAGALREVAAPLATITGALSVGGMARLVAGWAAFGNQLNLTGQRLQTGATNLHTMQGAARVLGSTGEALTASFQGFREVMTDAAGGRNNEVLGYLNMLGVRMKTATGEVNKGREGFDQILDSIARLRNNPELQVRLMRAFGISEQLWPAARRGAAAFREAEERARRFGAMSEKGAAAATQFTQAQTDLSLALEGLGRSIAEKFGPPAAKMLTRLAELIADNRGLATAGTALAAVLAGPLALAAGRFALSLLGIGSAFTALRPPAWLLPFLGIGAVAGLGALAGEAQRDPAGGTVGQRIKRWLQAQGVQFQTADDLARPLPGQAALQRRGWAFRNEGQDKARAYFEAQGWTREQAAGIVANLQHESMMNPGAVGDSGRSFGLAQWNGARLEALGRFIGRDPRSATFEEQLRFIQHELTAGGERAAGAALRGARSAAEAGAIVSRQYERPAAEQAEAEARARTAAWLSGLERPQWKPLSLQDRGAAGGNGEVTVRVDIGNAPPGTRATATATGGARVEPPRVERAMPMTASP